MLRHSVWLLGVKSPAREVRLSTNWSLHWFRRCDLSDLPTLVLQAVLLFDVLIIVLIGPLELPIT